MSDKINIEILDDGSLKIETDQISAPNHVNAEAALREMFELAGGAVTKKRKTPHVQVQQKQQQRQ